MAAKNNKGLGIGLDVLFGGNDFDEAESELLHLPISKVEPRLEQPREYFDEDALQELADSIAQYGLIQPITVRKLNTGYYQIIAGERRWRASRLAGLTEVPVRVIEADDRRTAELALVENLQREDLHYLEEAQCYQKLLETYGLTQEELANRLGKSQSSIANKLRLLKLSDEVKAAMTEKRLSERHARALLKLTDDKQRLDAVKRIAEKGLSVKETEQMVEKTLNKAYDEKQDGAKPRPKLMRIVRDYRLFMNTINQAVNQLRESGMTVEVEQSDRADGVDIKISVTRK